MYYGYKTYFRDNMGVLGRLSDYVIIHSKKDHLTQ